MNLTDTNSLVKTTDAVIRADFFGDKITKRDAVQATRFLESRWLPIGFPRDVPPEQQTHIFLMTDVDRKSKLKNFAGEPIDNAAARMSYSRETARALIVLGKLTGNQANTAQQHCADMRQTALGLPEKGQALF